MRKGGFPTDDARPGPDIQVSDRPVRALDDLLEDPDALAEILLDPLVPDAYTVADSRERSEMESAPWQHLTLESARAGLTVNGSSLLTCDIRASNGIVHVITSVPIP